MLLKRRHDERARRDRQAGDKRVQAVGRRLRERDTSRPLRIPERGREVSPGRIERGVVGGVPDVPEHPNLVQPGAESLGGALCDGEGGPGPRDVEIERIAPQRLECGGRGVRALVDRGRSVVGHAVMMPRIASPAVKSAAKPSATDWPRGARSRTSDAASGMASASANP